MSPLVGHPMGNHHQLSWPATSQATTQSFGKEIRMSTSRPSTVAPTTIQAPACGTCGLVPPKYRCPACSIRTCSLECSTAHKASSGCTGKRCRTEYVPMDTFDDRQLLSDCGFLEDAHRTLSNARKSGPGRQQNGFRFKRRAYLPRHLVTLIKTAKRGGIDLQVMPMGMDRRRSNSTSCFGKGRIKWHVEWRFCHLGNVVSVSNRAVDEDRQLGEILKGHLSVDCAQESKLFKLKSFLDAGVPELRVLMKKEGCVHVDGPLYWEVPLASSLKEFLAGKMVIEFPIFCVFLKSTTEGLNVESFVAHKPAESQETKAVADASLVLEV